MGNPTLDEVIDAAMQLPDDQREQLVSILRMRQLEARREEIARDAQDSLARFRAGELQPRPVEEALKELHQSLEDEE
jgi:hypothetical protein